MKEPRKTVILLILLALGIATFFWSRWRLKAQLGKDFDPPASSQTAAPEAVQ